MGVMEAFWGASAAERAASLGTAGVYVFDLDAEVDADGDAEGAGAKPRPKGRRERTAAGASFEFWAPRGSRPSPEQAFAV